MFNIPWLHVKYTFNVVQNTLMYIKSIGTSQEVTKLQLILWLNEHKGLFFGEKPKSYSISKDVQFSSRIIITKIVIKLKRWLLIVKMINDSCKWRIVTCNCKLNGYIIQDFKKCLYQNNN
jgi:hypothetical protein